MSHSSGYKFDKVVFKTPREQINALITEVESLRDEVNYHREDAKKWSLQALKFDKWQPIETAPKIGRCLATMKTGAISVIVWLDADHPAVDEAGWYEHWHFDPVEPTHWMPLPKPAQRLERG